MNHRIFCVLQLRLVKQWSKLGILLCLSWSIELDEEVSFSYFNLHISQSLVVL
jgi:hypothetical protein